MCPRAAAQAVDLTACLPRGEQHLLRQTEVYARPVVLGAARALPETLRESLLVVTAVGDEAQKRAQRVIVADEFVEAGAHAIPLSFLPL